MQHFIPVIFDMESLKAFLEKRTAINFVLIYIISSKFTIDRFFLILSVEEIAWFFVYFHVANQ